MTLCLCCNSERFPEDTICPVCRADWQSVEALDLDLPRAKYKSQVEKMLARDPNGQYDKELTLLRYQLKVSYKAHQQIRNDFLASIKDIEHLKSFQLRFNQSAEGVAGQNTLLQFEFTNTSERNYFSRIKLEWDDEETVQHDDFEIDHEDLLGPGTRCHLQSTYVFKTPGTKLISKLVVSVEGMAGETAKFRASDFQLKVADPNKRDTYVSNVTNNVTAKIVSEYSSSSGAASAEIDEKGSGDNWLLLKVVWMPSEGGLPKAPPANMRAPGMILAASAATERSSVASKAHGLSCQGCGKLDNPSGSAFCLNCGRSLAQAPAATEELLAPEPVVAVAAQAASSPSEASIETLHDAVEQTFELLRKFSALASSSASKGVFSAVDFAFELLNELTPLLLDRDIVGMVCEKPAGVQLDDEEFIVGFAGKATVFSLTGITVVEHSGTDIAMVERYQWGELEETQQGVFRQRFGPQSYVISLGNASASSSFPGLRFDMRRYKGPDSIEDLYSRLEFLLGQVFSLAPEPVRAAAPKSFAERVEEVPAFAAPEVQNPEDEADFIDDGVQAESEITEHQGRVTCSNCGAENHAHAKFCAECGSVLHADQSQEEDDIEDDETSDEGLIQCRHCGANNLENAKFCAECGQAQGDAPANVLEDEDEEPEGVPCVSCGASIDEDLAFCGFCGANQSPPEPEPEIVAIQEPVVAAKFVEPPEEEVPEVPQVDPRLELMRQRWHERSNALHEFLLRFAMATQYCSETAPKTVVMASEIDATLHADLWAAAKSSGAPLVAVGLDAQHALWSESGQLADFHEAVTLMSAHGLFHIAKSGGGAMKLDGKNCFLSWEKFFFEFKADLVFRDAGPDLWLGTADKYLVRGSYCDYSVNVLQWDYLNSFVKNELIDSFEKFKFSVQHTHD